MHQFKCQGLVASHCKGIVILPMTGVGSANFPCYGTAAAVSVGSGGSCKGGICKNKFKKEEEMVFAIWLKQVEHTSGGRK